MIYEVLVVDDESLIAEGLKFLIERMVPECRVVDLAFDGLQGYKKAMELTPHIVLTDIRMPECDGIEMIRRLKEAGNPARFIILSGYAEFKYARSAMVLGVEDYITKPVEEDELCSVLRKSCNSILESRKKSELALEMEHSMKEYMLKDILELSGSEIEKKKSRLGNLGFPVMCQWYNCIVLEYSRAGQQETEKNFHQNIVELADKYFYFSKSRIVIPYSGSMAVVILAFDKEADYRHLLNAAGRFRLELAEKIGVSVSGGAGLTHHKIEEIRESFEEARCALNYKVIKGPDCIISYEEIRRITAAPKLIESEDVKKLEACIDRMDDKGCRQIIEEIFYKVEKEKDLTPGDLQLLSLNLVLTGIRKMPFMQFQLNEYLGRNILSLESIAKFQTIEQLKNWIINTIKSMNELMLKENIPEKQDVVTKAKEYIDKNFNKKISLNDISERFYINPYYFSQLFKRKTGETYHSYITGLRISRAMRLLEETNLNIYEICEMVGYSDPNHFNKMFERRMGVKPSEYKRNNHRSVL
ncbi:MAG: AraC family transcriptional regulator [Herbinix sp.]|jgi:two-component system response regulator YesN|nr:AraC family transcriptional regulator [Herbinix sp.]